MIAATIAILAAATMNPPDLNAGHVASQGQLYAHNEQGSLSVWSFHNEGGGIRNLASGSVTSGESASGLRAVFFFTPGVGSNQVNPSSSYAVTFVYESNLVTTDPLPSEQGIVRFQGLLAHNESGEMLVSPDHLDARQNDPSSETWRTYTLSGGTRMGWELTGGLELTFDRVDPLCDTTSKIEVRVRCVLVRE